MYVLLSPSLSFSLSSLPSRFNVLRRMGSKSSGTLPRSSSGLYVSPSSFFLFLLYCILFYFILSFYLLSFFYIWLFCYLFLFLIYFFRVGPSTSGTAPKNTLYVSPFFFCLVCFSNFLFRLAPSNPGTLPRVRSSLYVPVLEEEIPVTFVPDEFKCSATYILFRIIQYIFKV